MHISAANFLEIYRYDTLIKVLKGMFWPAMQLRNIVII